MFTRKEIEYRVGAVVNEHGFKHISDMFEEIQRTMFTGCPNSKFIELCAKENWDYALGIADNINKQALEKTTLYQDFINDIKKLPDYISMNRDKQINKLNEPD